MSSSVGANQLWFKFDRAVGFELLGSHRIELSLDAHLDSAPESTIALWGAATIAVEFGNRQELLGIAHQTMHCPFRPGVATSRLVLAVDVHRHQLESIEQHRQGRSVKLLVSYSAMGHSERDPPSIVNDHMACDLSAAQWSEVLAQTNYATAFLFSVPLVDGATIRGQAGMELLAARRSIDDGRYPDAIVHARRSIELLWRDPSGGSLVGSVAKHERTKDQRFLAVADALFELASAAVHSDQHTANIVWLRDDANAVVGAAAALLARSER